MTGKESIGTNATPVVALRHLVDQHGVVAVLQALASVMADRGNVTGGMVSEVAAMEEWLASSDVTGVNDSLS